MSGGLFKKLSNKTVGLLIVLCIMLATAITVLYTYSIIANSTVFMVVCTICIVLMMMFVSELSSRFALKRLAKKNSNPKPFSIESFDSLKEILIANNAIVSKFDFGSNYLLIKGSTAYRICIVDNNDLYFNRETKEKSKGDKRLDKCDKFYGLEIFKSLEGDILSKVELFSFQSDNICYTGFYYDSESTNLIQANYEDIKDIHKENFNYIINLLNIKEINNNEVE